MKQVVKLEALRALASHIELSIPELKDRVKVHQVPPEQALKFPSLAVIGGRYKYVPSLEGVASSPSDETVVVNLGAWDVTVQLRLAAAELASRYELQDRIEELFFVREGSPGLLLVQVTSCPALGSVLSSWDLDDEAWDEEMAFSSIEWGMLTLRGTIPALATRGGVYSMNDLRLGLTDDFTLPATSAAFDTIPTIVKINADGTVTPI